MTSHASARLLVALLGGVVLAGCADCNLLSSRMPGHCEAGLGAALLLTAPILVPYALIEEAMSGPGGSATTR